MTLPLTPHIVEQAYEFLRATPPFNKWNLPDGEDMVFKVVGSATLRGWYNTDDRGRHVIAISRRNIGFSDNLIRTMAHEMIHLHQRDVKMETNGQHNAAFNRLAARVCKLHGFDPKLF